MKKRLAFIIIFLIACIAAGYFVLGKLKNPQPTVVYVQEQTVDADKAILEKQVEKQSISSMVNEQVQPEKEETDATIAERIEQDVPFIVQAPFGNWNDPIFQNGCEEASMAMAMGWVRDIKTISSQEAQKQILDIVAFENKIFGYNADTGKEDMQKIFQQYFKYDNVKIQENIKLSDIKNELAKGNVVLLPVFGRALKNPNFTSPGPIAHMLVVIGYDPTAKEFITNDPGTKRGNHYRYAEEILFEAVWEYPNGSDIPAVPIGARKKSMLVVQPQ